MARDINIDATRAAGSFASTSTAQKADDNGANPDYTSPTYRAMTMLWQLCADAKEGTPAYRRKASTYLPRMKSETPQNWQARVDMTFSGDHYASTLDDLEGLACTEDPAVADDVPQAVQDLVENIDGRGSSLAVLARRAFRESIDDGHVVLYTDYPAVSDPSRLTIADIKARRIRPYVSIREAQDVLSAITTVVGGEEVLTQVVFREWAQVALGQYGTTQDARYRVLRQDVITEPHPETGDPVAIGLGAMTWEVWKKVKQGTGNRAKDAWVMTGTGTIVATGLERLPVRIAYGGDQLGVLHSRPFLASLAYTQLEEVQVKSDYANIMHKCNVPTPVFIGRSLQQQGDEVVMGEGIDIPQGGNALMLEPTGVAITSTRDRLEDLRVDARRKGATLNGAEQGMTATEAAIAARQRNARLAVAVQSNKNAWEGALADLACFLGVVTAQGQKGAKGGGSLTWRTDFAAGVFDHGFVDQCRQAWDAGALPLDAFLHVLKTGKLPDDFDADEVAALQEAAVEAKRSADAADAAAAAGEQLAANAGDAGTAKAKGKKGAKKTPAAGGTPGDAAGRRAARASSGV